MGKNNEKCCVKLSKYDISIKFYKYHWFLHMFPLYTGATGRQQVWNHSTHSNGGPGPGRTAKAAKEGSQKRHKEGHGAGKML
jgi:hypothetical protein